MRKRTANSFVEEKDEAVIARVLAAAARKKLPASLWLKVPDFKYEAIFTDYFQHSWRLALTAPSGVELEGEQEVIASFQVDAHYFFFRTVSVQGRHAGRISLAIPRSLYRLQRRATLRIPFSRSVAPKLTALDPEKTRPGGSGAAREVVDESLILSFRVLNISAGGVAIAVLPSQKSKFRVGLRLEDMRFKIRGTEISASGLVRNIVDAKNERGQPLVRVGVQFERIRHDYERLIARFVLEESRRIFTLVP